MLKVKIKVKEKEQIGNSEFYLILENDEKNISYQRGILC